MLGKTEGKRRRGQERMRWLDSITDPMDMNLSDLWEIVKDRWLVCCSPWCHRVWHDLVTEQEQSAYLMLLLFLWEILIPACDSSSWALHMMYSAYKLNKQSYCTPFPIWNQSVVPCLVLTGASWPAYRFLRRQVRWSGIPISLRIFLSLLSSTQSKALV